MSSSSPCEGLPFFLSIVQYAVCEDVALNFWCKRIIRVRVCAASSCRTFKDAVPISRKRVKSGDEAAVEHHATFWVNVPRNAPVTDHARRCWGWITGRLIPVNRFKSVLNRRSETDASKSNNISKYNTKHSESRLCRSWIWLPVGAKSHKRESCVLFHLKSNNFMFTSSVTAAPDGADSDFTSDVDRVSQNVPTCFICY